MRAFVLFITLLISIIARSETTTPIVPNGDFENWDISSYSFPENYLFNSNAFKAMTNEPYNVIQTADSYHGKSAVKLVTDATTNSVNFGFMVGSNGENGDPTTWKGGIPITQPIKGIRGYYKYDFVQPDSAIIILTFRYHGTFLAEYEFFLKEKKSAYTLFEFDIIPKWDIAISPDSIIVGFASSGNVNGGSGQPGSTLYLDSISFTGVTTQPDALNGDFERWTQHINPTLKDWNFSSSNQETNCRTTDKYEGNFAVKLTTVLGSMENNQPVENNQALYIGNYDNMTGKWLGGIPLNNTMDTLSFWYKYVPNQPNHEASVMLLLMGGNGQPTGNMFSIPASPVYQEMKIAMRFPNLPYAYPSNLILMFQSSQMIDSTLSHVGSTLFLDHITIIPFKGNLISEEKPNPELKNGSFEIWDSRWYDNPAGYPFTSNTLRLDGSFPFNATKTTLSQHGSYALRLETDNLTGNANFGFVINQSPTSESPNNWTGGIPISEKPTGVQGYYTFHSVGLDSAMIMLHFRKGGNNIGIYYLHLKPAMSGWTFFNKLLEPPLAETPDSMILTIASGSNLVGQCPPGSVLTIDNISLTGVTTQPVGLNGDFEDWVTTRMETAPGWYLSDQDNPGSHQSMNAAEGSYAMELKTTAYTKDGQSQVEQMWMSNGYWDRNSQNWGGGSPLYTMNDSLAFYYRYIPAVPDDTAQVSLMFKYQGQFIATKQAYLMPNSAWQYKKVSLQQEWGFPMLFPADSILMIFQSSLWGHNNPRYAGSTLLLDDIHFISSRAPVGLITNSELLESEIYPNPSQGVSRIRFEGKLPLQVEVFNLSGIKILSIPKGSISSETVLDLSGHIAGLYLVKITGEQRTNYLKLVLK